MDKKIFDFGGKSLKFAFWNIRGYNSRVIGKKISSEDFLKEIEGYDVIGLAETHIHSCIMEDLSIPGYILIDYINRECNKKSNTAPGGIALFCKENISKHFIPTKRENKNVLWVKIKKEFIGWNKDIYIGTVYLSPTGNKENVLDKYHALTEDISHFQGKGYIILQGDFNAHSNNNDDFIEFDEHIGSMDREDYHPLPPRNSEDTKKADMRGEELIGLCKTLNISILNGRKTGDLFGKITSYQWNGLGVVDYTISSYALFSSIKYFKVGAYSPWVSDHCPLFFNLNIQKVPTKPALENLSDLPDKYFFDEKCKAKFTETLKSNEISDKLNSLYLSHETNTDLLASEITDTLLEVCKKSNIKPIKKKCNVTMNYGLMMNVKC